MRTVRTLIDLSLRWANRSGRIGHLVVFDNLHLILGCYRPWCIFQLLGIGVMVVGIILKTNNAFLNDDVLNFLDQIVLGSLTLKDLLFIIIGIVIALGVFSILTSLVGGIGSILKVRVMLIIVSMEG